MGVSAYLSLIGMRRGWALIRGWVLINFFCLWDGRLFEVGANSRLVAYSNNYGNIPYWVYTVPLPKGFFGGLINGEAYIRGGF